MSLKNKDLSVAAIILCAGASSRSKLGYNKVLFDLGFGTALDKCIDAFMNADIHNFIFVANPKDMTDIKTISNGHRANCVVVEGGNSRTESVRLGLKGAQVFNADIISIHDGARPFVTKEIIQRTVESAVNYGSGIAAVKATDFTVIASNGKVSPIDRDSLYNIQTPQTFDYNKITAAYDKWQGAAFDDSTVYNAAFGDVRLTDGDYSNIKLTVPADFAAQTQGVRSGIGYDVHQLVSGRKLILLGELIPFEKGLLGHSDADVATHALMDALLSAAALPDIGTLFPDTSAEYEGANSMELLKQVLGKIRQIGLKPFNAAITIAAQAPKLSPYKLKMRENMATALCIDINNASVHATTTEQLGIVGEGKGIAAFATATLFKA